jgi:hypothetical protein
MKLTKQQRKAIEGCDWNITKEENGYLLSQYSPAGEDFSFHIEKIDDIKQYADDFDAGEHVEMWIEARRDGVGGVPSTRELIEDATDIKNMLLDLARAVED